MKYERLTKRIGKCICIEATSKNGNKSILNAINRLAELEDKIEDGTLVELPCKVGDTVYTIFCNHKGELCVSETIIAKICFNELGIYYLSLYDEPLFDIYKTKAEAEAKLKELQEE